jgi:hypothetical protein
MSADLVLDAAVGPGHRDAHDASVVETQRQAVTDEFWGHRIGPEIDAPFESLQARDGHPVGGCRSVPRELVPHAVGSLIATAQLAHPRAFFDLSAQRMLRKPTLRVLQPVRRSLLAKADRSNFIQRFPNPDHQLLLRERLRQEDASVCDRRAIEHVLFSIPGHEQHLE